MGAKPEATRFATRYQPGDPAECWPWQGRLHRQGYGLFDSNNKKLRAHRVSYEMHVGPIPDGMFVLHSCDNPPCVNPHHLSVGDNAQNLAEAGERGLMWRKLSPEQVKAMRQRRADGARNTEIAKEFGVSQAWASIVTRGIGRKYVPIDEGRAWK